ncbi:hypothetical protein OR263_18035 [Streptomyces sp. NEAU-H22]|uniref:hypothetical protein n=1 Tax=unclassified Streptomyces TaxID=2593676 RepID=UPI002258D6B4|nr:MULTISPECIES: hypothetical protein [unclassified Streptomyces]MCX3288582.1 hypothetical protein [Streptomyces sp. NEAU-H22]WMD08519.1 hypothetical protein Q7C01_30910 [Streptomyces sp. FXY-T5]
MNLSLGVRMLIFMICFLFSVIIGIVAGLIHHKPTTPKGPTFLYGGGVFGGSLTLCLVVLTSLRVF